MKKRYEYLGEVCITDYIIEHFGENWKNIRVDFLSCDGWIYHSPLRIKKCVDMMWLIGLSMNIPVIIEERHFATATWCHYSSEKSLFIKRKSRSCKEMIVYNVEDLDRVNGLDYHKRSDWLPF